MLAYLAIRDFAIIDRLRVEFESGFSVLTGETGAGKSILVQALHLLLGGRASADMIRTDKDAAEVEAEFRPGPAARILGRLAEMGLAEDEAVTIRRVVSRSGRNRVFVNGRAVNLTTLAEFARGLADISGQHEHVELTDEDTHREILDDFGGLGPLVDGVRATVRHFRDVNAELARLEAREKERAEREEFVAYALRRIDEVDPKTGEDELLRQEATRLRNAEKLSTGANDALVRIYEGEGAAVEQLGLAASTLAGLVPFDPEFAELQERLQVVVRQVEDVARDLRDAGARLEADPERLEEVEARLQALRGLMRVHGPDLAAVIQKRESFQAEQDGLTTLVDRLSEVRDRRDEALETALTKARGLTGKRKTVGRRLQKKLERELGSLAMKEARFEVEVRSGQEENLEEWGLDRVRFLLSANPGEEVRPLQRVASGGELSRVLLALKAVLSEVDRVPSYVFDEVDAGVGGAVAEVIGAKLATVARHHQVLCITHLPQIAAHASRHFSVRKKVAGGRTVSEVIELDEEERVEELARMTAGSSVTDKARGHARELLRDARGKTLIS